MPIGISGQLNASDKYLKCLDTEAYKRTLMKHIVDTVNKINLTIKPLELAGRVPFTDSIELLRVELQYQDGYGPLFMGRVRYALDGVEQEDGFPLDLHKGAFIATVPIQEAGLEEKLQEIGPEIAKIVYEDLAKQRLALV